MSGDVGNSSGETKAVGKKKLHHLNPRRRNKLKQKVPDLPLSEEEKHRRAEQKKRRVSTAAAAVAGFCFGGCCGFSSALEDLNASKMHTLVCSTQQPVPGACAVATQASAAAQAARHNCMPQSHLNCTLSVSAAPVGPLMPCTHFRLHRSWL